MVAKCPALEKVTLNGLKSLTDAVFGEYVQFKAYFKEKHYDEVKYEFRKECKHAKEIDLPQIYSNYNSKTALDLLF